jgi:uncharacterized phage protein gp47/JayE
MGRSTFEVPSLDELHERTVADYENRFPDADVSSGSDEWKRTRVTALAVTDAHAHLDRLYGDILPDENCTGSALDRWGDMLALPRKVATPAFKADALRITGTAASAITAGDELVHADGTRYQVDETTVVPISGEVDVDVIAIDTGSVTAKEAGEFLRFVATPAGLQETAELQLDLDEGGVDDEEDGDYRARILNKLQQPEMGGNANDYASWLLQQDGVDQAFVYSNRQGLGSVDVAFLKAGTGDTRIPTAGEISDAQDALDELRPIGIADFRVLTPVMLEIIDIEVSLDPYEDPAYEFDWDDQAPLVVLTWVGATRTLTFSTDRPGDMEVGHRLVIESVGAPYNDGAEMVIESLSSTNAVVITTASVPDEDPVATDTVYSGGPLVADVREAIIEVVNNLGTARETTAATKWDDSVRPAALLRASLNTSSGIRDANVVLPASVQTPSAATVVSGDVNVYGARRIIVRKAW